jgi:hypothetical protein
VLTSSTSMYIVHIVPSTLYIVHCTLYIVHCNLYIVQYLQYNEHQICHRHGNSRKHTQNVVTCLVRHSSRSLKIQVSIPYPSEIQLRQPDHASLVSLTYDDATSNLPNLFSYKSQFHCKISHLTCISKE